jgi:hypothetical protein
MEKLFSVYRVVNALSFDVAAGAMICAVFFARRFNVVVFPQGVITLGLAVWIIYTVDHLADAKRLNHQASTFRHRFHQKYFKQLSLLAVLALLTESVLLFFIREKLLYAGLGVGLLTGLYILFHRWMIYTKEVAGALLYCGGIFLPSLTFQQRSLLFFDGMVIAQFFLIVLINLILFSWIDYEEDVQDQNPSLATQMGKNSTSIILIVIFALQFLLTGYTILMGAYLGFIYLLMESVLLMLFLFPEYFKRHNRYRFWGDAIFFFPLLVFFL